MSITMANATKVKRKEESTSLTEAERVERNNAKRKRRKLWKEQQRKSMEPIELFGLRYFYPYVGGKRGKKESRIDFGCFVYMGEKEFPKQNMDLGAFTPKLQPRRRYEHGVNRRFL